MKMVKIQNLIAAISPDVYCKPELRKEVKAIAKESGYLAAADKADLVDIDDLVTLEEIKAKPLDAKGIKAPYQNHRLIYDSAAEGLEPIYFYILDFLNKTNKNVTKLVDNFVSSTGSAHFSELGMKATTMQKEAMNMLGTVNQVVRSVLNIIYDLKEFRIRLDVYDKYKNSSGADKQAAILSLKQIWLDKVDINKGTTSIKGMVQNFDYVTLIDAFMAADSVESVTKSVDDGGLDLNDRVRRILQSRLLEFYKWITESESELRKRYEIEKHYLRSQVNTLKLYARWVRPYLDAARQLEQRMKPSAALVTTFNTILLELSIIAENEYKPSSDVQTGDLPELFANISKKKYYSLLMVELKFRGIPQRVGQGYSFGGRTEVSFFGFSLTKDELDTLKEEIEKDNLKDVLGLIEGATKDSLEQVQKDIDEFLNEDKKEKKEEKKEYVDDTNPFSALFSFFFEKKKEDKKDDKKKQKDLSPDNSYEKVLRSQAIAGARDLCLNLFEIYKKAHQMPAF